MSVEYAHTSDPGYYENERLEAVRALPRPLGRVLDVGCGAGGVGRALRSSGASELVGVELEPGPAESARAVFDRLHVCAIEQALAEGVLDGPFDTIVAYDVLEHLVDPSAVVDGLHALLRPGGHIHVSVPNARHFSLILDLVLRGTFGYTSWGHRDATHLRWFTRRDMERLLESRRLHVLRSDPAVLGRGQLVNRLSAGVLSEFLALQWHVLARRA
jgi:2-polyprenyl-3-methyl-5-hydroxy-6-metoxy-1,4-benzoquinol methylase